MTDSFGAKTALQAGDRQFAIYQLDALQKEGVNLARLPYSLKILLENLLRTENGLSVTADDIRALANWNPKAAPNRQI